MVNKTDAWWVGPDRAMRGATVSVYGRNLAKGNVEGSSNAYVYLRSLSGGTSQWVTVSKVNPYKIDFTIPSSLANGEYEVWTHNGHGGEYGWSGPLKLTVWDGLQWNATTFNVKNYGARGDGSSDDRAAINQAIAAAKAVPGATIYFPAGTYAVSGPLSINSNARWKGDTDPAGQPSSTILCKNYSGGSLIFSAAAAIKNNSFEDIRMVSNGQSVGEFFIDIAAATTIQWINCEVDARGADAMRFRGGSSYIYLTNTTLIGGKSQWGSTVFTDGIKQFFVDRCTFKMTNDCSAAIVNKGIKQASVTNSLIKDLDNSTTDGSGWGKGRIWSATGAGGTSYHCYFAGNTGTGLGVRQSGSNLPDPNSGEVFLWEANGAIFKGTPTAAAASSVSFSSSVPNTIGSDPTAKPLALVIVKGKGMGQFRRITNNGGTQLTLDRPWEVMPDASSVILVGPFVEKMVIYKNALDANGKSYIANNGVDKATASAGIEPYGGCFDFIGDANTFQGLRKGISTWALQHSVGVDPTYFTLFTNNKMLNCRIAIHHGTEVYQNEGIGIMAAVYRKNTIQSPIQTSIHNEVRTSDFLIISSSLYEQNN
ncbi:MAG TPA: glycosyl hydrolase family 28-related protein, partial [Chitinophagaceae bacterium]|nr:glycosyl hydrolase family 28-related protein [Chitinophagaceae bacterium]